MTTLAQSRQHKRMPSKEGLLYEPRAFWSYGRYASADAATSPAPAGTVLLPKEHFYNGSKHPITLLYALVCPLNYTYDLYRQTVITGPPNWRNCGAAAMADTKIVISSRQRQHYLRIPGILGALPPRPMWESQPGDIGQTGSLDVHQNTYRWEFDVPMVLPRMGSMEFGLGRYTLPAFAGQPLASAPVTAWVKTEEIGSLALKGAARAANFRVRNTTTPNTPAAFPPDGFGPSSTNANGPGIWDPTQALRAQDFQSQGQSSDGSTPIVSLATMIDQKDYDDELTTNPPGNTSPGARISPLGFRIPTRARTTQGGTNEWWWREGAPLALVSPHRTPAQVFNFRHPLTLGPGDNLEIELTFPQGVASGGEPINRVTQVAISFCGYAAISA